MSSGNARDISRAPAGPSKTASGPGASPPAAHRWRRYYDAETRAHYWYDARTQVVSWSDPERPPRDPAHARRPTAASLARSLPGSPQRLRFHCCAVESADSEPEEEPKPQRRRRPAPGYLKARRTPRRGAYDLDFDDGYSEPGVHADRVWP